MVTSLLIAHHRAVRVALLPLSEHLSGQPLASAPGSHSLSVTVLGTKGLQSPKLSHLGTILPVRYLPKCSTFLQSTAADPQQLPRLALNRCGCNDLSPKSWDCPNSERNHSRKHTR